MNTREKIISAIGLVVLGTLLALAFRAYLSPSMLIDFASLSLCS